MEGIGAGQASPPDHAGASGDELAAVDRAMAALEGQRATLGDDVVETALAPLRERRAALAAPRAEERRLVTVVFADLVDFTVLSRRLDAEDTREVVNSYFALWQELIEAQDGTVEKFIGDAVMAVFGLQHSFEDDAQRAVRAALAMRDALPGLSERIQRRYGVELHMRVGVDTGDVVVSTLGERAGHEFVAVGPTVNRASRLQSAAPVDRVLISSETHRQIRGRFSFEPVPALQLKGIDEPVDAYVVGRERPQGFHLDRAGGIEGVEATTVGRDMQLRFLQERLWDVKDEERWRVVTVVGDAGLGKSRLLHEFDAWLAESPDSVWWFRGRASQAGRNRPHGLLRDLLTARLGIQETDTTPQIREKFEAGFEAAYGAGRGRRASQLVGTWLGFDLDDETEDLPSDPQALRDEGTRLLAEYFAELSRVAPVVALLEDVHWADDGSLRWLDAADAVLHDARVLVVATTRPSLFEERPRWGEGLVHHVRLPLPALSRRESRELVRQLLQKVADLPADLVDLVVEAADGNPFYMEELVSWLIDAGVVVRSEPSWLVVDELVRAVAVPSTLKGVLQSRLDALSATERILLQRASVVGRVFWDDAVAHLGTPLEESADVLDTLRRREIVFEREVSAFDTAHEYLFKHALLRDVAYDSVLRAHRERYHLLAARWLAEVSTAAGREEEYAALVAEHYERAHDDAAAGWYLRAGRQAASVFALEEATHLYQRALDLVPEADGELAFDIHTERQRLFDRIGDRPAQEKELQGMTALGEHLDIDRRIALLLARTEWTFQHSQYAEADELARQATAEATQAARADLVAATELWRGKVGTWAEDAETARPSLDRAAELARATGQPRLEGEALRYLGMLSSNTGQYAEALEFCDRSEHVFAAAGDAEGETMALAMRATVLFHLNRLHESREAMERSLPIFRRSGHRYRESLTLGNLASISLMQGQFAEAERWSSDAVRVGVELQDLESQATNLTVLGMIESVTARYDEAAAHLHESLALARTVGSRTHETDALQRLVIVELGRGDVAAALDSARQARTVSEQAPSSLETGQAYIALGYAAGAAGLWEESEESFRTGIEVFTALGLDEMVRESRVGHAGALHALGRTTEAAETVRDVLPGLDAEGVEGTVSPGRIFLTAWQVLRAADDPEAASVLARAQAYLRQRAAAVGDDELAAGYLRVPVHVQLLETTG